MREYLKKFLDASDPSASLKHAAYAIAVLASVFWLTWDMLRGPINAEWCAAYGIFLTLVTVGKIAERNVTVEAGPASGSEPTSASDGSTLGAKIGGSK